VTDTFYINIDQINSVQEKDDKIYLNLSNPVPLSGKNITIEGKNKMKELRILLGLPAK